jgi:hypothetical protein
MKNLVPSGGMELATFLDKYGSQLRHTRVLYVVEPNLEKGKVVKFGIAGENTGNAYARLNEYVINYGKSDSKNKCKGVKIWYCGVTEYSRDVTPTQSQVHKIELRLKKDERIKKNIARGTERVKMTPQQIISIIQEYIPKEQDVKTDMNKRVARENTKRYRDDNRAFINSKTTRETRMNTRQEKRTQDAINNNTSKPADRTRSRVNQVRQAVAAGA